MKKMGGFTIIELLIASSIAVGLGLVIILLLKVTQQTWEVTDLHLTRSGQIRRAVESISRELAAADANTVDSHGEHGWYGGDLTFQVPKDMDEDGSVVLPNGTLELSDTITYTVVAGPFSSGAGGNRLIRRQANHNDRVIADGVGLHAMTHRLMPGHWEMMEIQLWSSESTPGANDHIILTSFKVRMRN